MVKKGIEGDGVGMGRGDRVKEEEGVRGLGGKVLRNMRGREGYVVIGVGEREGGRVDEWRKGGILEDDIGEGGMGMGEEEMVGVGDGGVEGGEELGWGEGVMVLVEMMVMEKRGLDGSRWWVDGMFGLVVEWGGRGMKGMEGGDWMRDDG